jgi:hypothetical protein
MEQLLADRLRPCLEGKIASFGLWATCSENVVVGCVLSWVLLDLLEKRAK